MSHTEPTSLSQSDETVHPSPGPSAAAGAAESTRLADQQPAPSASLALTGDAAPASSTPLHEINADFWGQFEVVELGSDSGAVAHPLSMNWWHSEQDTESLETSLQQVKQIDNCHFVRSKDGRIYILNGNRRTTLLWKHGQTSRGYMIPEDALAGLNCVTVVAALNNEVRHQTASQRALTAASFREEFAKEADRRRRAGTSCDNSHDPSNTGAVRDILGRLFHCDGKLVDAATKVLESRIADLADAVRQDKLSVQNAAKLLALPSNQRKVVAAAALANDKAAVRSWLTRANEARPKRGTRPLRHDHASTKEDRDTANPQSKAQSHKSKALPKGLHHYRRSEPFPSSGSNAIDDFPKTGLRQAPKRLLDASGTATEVTPDDGRASIDRLPTSPGPVRATRSATPKLPTAEHLLCTVGEAVRGIEALLEENRRFGAVVIEPRWHEMTVDQLSRLPIPDVLYADAAVALWAPPAVLPALDVLQRWGMTPVESVVAIGDSEGHGLFFPSAHRLVLIATRGNPRPPVAGEFEFSWFGHRGDTVKMNVAFLNSNFPLLLPGPLLRIFGSREGLAHREWTFAACLPEPE